MNSEFPKCKECGKDLINGMDMAAGICGQCWFDSKESYDEDNNN